MEENIEISTINDLEKKLSSAKRSLVSLNDNIRRIVGRGLKESRAEKYTYDGLIRRTEGNDDKNILRHDVTKHKRRMPEEKIVFNRLSDNNEMWLPAPRLNSRVIRELPSREEIVEAQGIDSESRARNRRMFGSLLGTLQKFCQEESRLKTTEAKKALIEKKLETQELQERALVQKERDTLFFDRKRKQLEIRCLENKMARLKDFKVWESSIIYQQHQIRTKTKPHIYFQPKIHTVHTEKLLNKSKCELNSLLERRRDELKVEIKKIESSNNLEDSLLADGKSYKDKAVKSNEDCDFSTIRDNSSKEDSLNLTKEAIPCISNNFVISET